MSIWKKYLWPILAAICGCGLALIILLERYDLYLHLGGLNNRRAAGALLLLCLGFLFLWADAVLLRRFKTTVSRSGFGAVLAGEILFLFLLMFVWNLGDWDYEPRYFALHSPDGAHTVVAVEESWLLGGWTYFYEPVCHGLMRKLDSSLSTDDGYRPFSNGTYELTWETDRLLVRYDFGSGGVWKTCQVPLKH